MDGRTERIVGWMDGKYVWMIGWDGWMEGLTEWLNGWNNWLVGCMEWMDSSLTSQLRMKTVFLWCHHSISVALISMLFCYHNLIKMYLHRSFTEASGDGKCGSVAQACHNPKTHVKCLHTCFILHQQYKSPPGIKGPFDFLFSEQTLNTTHHSYFSFRLYK